MDVTSSERAESTDSVDPIQPRVTTRVNIIYVGGTVARLMPFLHSILVHTTWPVNLVMNGCDAAEERLLTTIATAHPDRVEVVTASKNRVLSHGDVLDRLLRDEPSPYFCTLDSDVFAAGPVDLAALLPTPDLLATCSCVPIWHEREDFEMPEGYRIAAGRFLKTESSDFLGCSYATAYRTDALRDVASTFDISLRSYKWNELPRAVQAHFESRNLRLSVYDTMKVANLLIQRDGGRMTYVEIPDLIHIGGQSSGSVGIRSGESGSGQRLRRVSSRWMPWLIAGVWRVRGLSAAESASLADLAHRKSKAEGFLEAMRKGTTAFEQAPGWLVDERDYHAVSAILRAGDAQYSK